MPRNIDPKKIRIKAAKRGVGSERDLHPNVITQTKDLTIEGPEVLWATNVQEAIERLSGSLAQRPPMLGEFHPKYGQGFSGIPDWGVLKAGDGDMSVFRKGEAPQNRPDMVSWGDAKTGYETWPYNLQAIGPAKDKEFLDAGNDPIDWSFNTGMPNSDNPPPAELGYGKGKARFGGYRRSSDGHLIRTARIIKRPGALDPAIGNKPERLFVTISGTLFPADRGVLALIHFAPTRGANMKTSFLDQPVVAQDNEHGRVVAALLLGNGLLSDGDPEACHSVLKCSVSDGTPGGVFSEGVDPLGRFDPFEFPGYASGQYDLKEIHTGVNYQNHPLKSPWDAGSKWDASDPSNITPVVGQVRLGVPGTGSGVPDIPYGVPVLGGTEDWYDVPPTHKWGSRGYPIHGESLIVDSNFFSYRLPVLKDYSAETGLQWTPRGIGVDTQEVFRYFVINGREANEKTLEDGAPVTDGRWGSAGNYPGFQEDCWPWQVARYRHTFAIPSISPEGVLEESGSYVLIHFKTESHFEKCVRDGVFPWDPLEGYGVYGVSVVHSPEDSREVANPWESPDVIESPKGPGESYGHMAQAYHVVRGNVVQDKEPDFNTMINPTKREYSMNAAGCLTTTISGVSYYTSYGGNQDTSPTLEIQNIKVDLDPGYWTNVFRTDEKDYGQGPGPSYIASQAPVYIGLPGFGSGSRRGFALSYGDMGSFDSSNAPSRTDVVTINHSPGYRPQGAETEGIVFTRDAKVRAFFRHPLGHGDPHTTLLPYDVLQGPGIVLDPSSQEDKVLYHGAKPDSPKGFFYGNFDPDQNSLLAQPTQRLGQERFLDEVMRIIDPIPVPSIEAIPAGTDPISAQQALVGPGMGTWASGPIAVSIMVSKKHVPNTEPNHWEHASWLREGKHLSDLSTQETGSLMVAGVPDRNPQVDTFVVRPLPYGGVLQYPQGDYTNANPIGPDYEGAVGERTYIRAFDVGASKQSKTNFIMQLDGLCLEDLKEVKIYVKVPGLTTWMDIGSYDGEGPSKQDPFQDGAGCQVFDGLSYDFIHPETGYVGCYVHVTVGMEASFFSSLEYDQSSTPYQVCPILVKVVMGEGCFGYNLEQGFEGSQGPGVAPWYVRGLHGMTIVESKEEKYEPSKIKDGKPWKVST